MKPYQWKGPFDRREKQPPETPLQRVLSGANVVNTGIYAVGGMVTGFLLGVFIDPMFSFDISKKLFKRKRESNTISGILIRAENRFSRTIAKRFQKTASTSTRKKVSSALKQLLQ